MPISFANLFELSTRGLKPKRWQADLAAQLECTNRTIRIPTGFGKTLGVLTAWLLHRVHNQIGEWPRRLIWCLPMRALVEQTEDEVCKVLTTLGLLWDSREPHAGKVGVHVLMGGADAGDWNLYPEECAVFIGTQDMLLSRALNRGYGTPRARWPMDFGLLHQDCLWVMDEVQLMDVGLATSAQLQAFRYDDMRAGREQRPCRTWWMSATLQPDWLRKSPDTLALTDSLPPPTQIPPAQRLGALWDDVSKPCRVESVPAEEDQDRALGAFAVSEHLAGGCGKHGPTLVVVNRVERAIDVMKAIRADRRIDLAKTDIRLVHSRFRPKEREKWRDEFLNKAACAAGTDRIIVATQVVEAGVDFSAARLITELAPWPSLVQRFGRCARWGGIAQVVVADFEHSDDKAAAPYEFKHLGAAREALSHLDDVSPKYLEAFEEQHSELLTLLYPYEPKQLLLRHELEELFDTTPDLSGADIDISRFIRSGDERDVLVFWEDIPVATTPPQALRANRDALCAVPFHKAREWLCGKETGNSKAPHLKRGMRAWVWDYPDGSWRSIERRDLYPGQVVLVAAECGGYDEVLGWTSGAPHAVVPVAPKSADQLTRKCWKVDATGDRVVSTRRVPAHWQADLADSGEEDESLSSSHGWQTIAFHGQQTGAVARALALVLAPSFADLFDLAGRWHDVGKAHPAFQASIRLDNAPYQGADIAKAPDAAWPCSSKQLYRISSSDHRAGFRHELASTLALFAVLQRHNPDHPALLGSWGELLTQIGRTSPNRDSQRAQANVLEMEVMALNSAQFNLLAYLVCTHHGKVRLTWHSSPADQRSDDNRRRIRGVCDGDDVPPVRLAAANGQIISLPASTLTLAPASAGLNEYTGQGWTERVLDLLKQHGPFALAWLEALLMAADRRASRNPQLVDNLIQAENPQNELDGHRTALAQLVRSGETRDSLAQDSAERGGEHGVRTGTGESFDAANRTRAPAHATRYVETALGVLSYTDLAPHLARRVQTLEQDIEAGEFDSAVLDDRLIEQLHRRICGDLTPQLTGWRRVDVSVGSHTPPRYVQVPLFMRDFSRDLAVRLGALTDQPDERLLETLAFSEGRLFSIHPFADFNGRVTRLWLRLILRRLDLPWVNLVPTPDGLDTYLAALRSADRYDWSPLAQLWRERFQSGGEMP